MVKSILNRLSAAILSGNEDEIDIAIKKSSISDLNKIDRTGHSGLMTEAEMKQPLTVVKLLGA